MLKLNKEKQIIGEERERKKYINTTKNGQEKMGIETMTFFMLQIQKDLKMKDNKPMKHNSKELEEIYNDVFAAAVEYMEEYEVQAIAATYMAIAMRLYKTTLDDKEYEEMIETVMESEVKPYKESKLH